MKQIFIPFEPNETVFIRLFRIKSADFPCETNKNECKYSFVSENFQKELNIYWGPRLGWKAFLHNLKQYEANIFADMRIFSRKYLQANISLYANICKRISAWMWMLKVLRIFAAKQIFCTKYLPVWENLKRIFTLQWIFAAACILASKSNICMQLCANILKRILSVWCV